MPYQLLSVLTVILLYTTCNTEFPAPAARDQSTAMLQVSKQQWHADLNFLASELPKRHANAFHFLPREGFAKEVSELDRRLDQLNRDEIFVGMDQIENSIGDGHTYIRIPADAPTFPVHFERFGKDYRLVAAADLPGARGSLGGRLVKVDGTPIERVHELLLTLTPADETQALRDVRATALLNDGLVLHGLGILADRNVAHYVVLTDQGAEVALEIHGAATPDVSQVGWLHAVPHPALYLQRPSEGFWCTYLQQARTGYCGFRSYKDLKNTSRALADLMQREHPDSLIVDLRLNAGGDFDLGLKYVVKPIRRMSTINRRGHLFVLIGPRTFSAAMANASHFRKQTKAILIGQPIGEKPNSYQEAREMTLPNSHWIARYSIKFYRFTSLDENLIRPDEEISETWADYEAGQDPVLNGVLAQAGLPSQKRVHS